MAQIKIGDEVRVQWEDHWEITDHLMTLSDIKEKCSHPYIGKARGIVVLNTRKLLVIASNEWQPHAYDKEKEKTYDGSIFCIIKKCITEIKVLK